ncbi:MAG: nuclear transport factor 2 family protein [Planctomycetota bacterium]|jgi:hypothetical protein
MRTTTIAALTLIAAATIALQLGARAASGSDVDDVRKAIEQAVLDYPEGWYEGSAERMGRRVHDGLRKCIIVPAPEGDAEKLREMTAEQLVQATGSGSGTRVPQEARKAKVTVLDVYENIASVKIEMHDWTDYAHVGKVDGEWRIINVLWTFNREARERYGLPPLK